MRYFFCNKGTRFLCLLAMLVPQMLHSHEQRGDSITHISEITVRASRNEAQPVVPVQQLSGKSLERLSVYSVADALRYFSGVQIKDYGGIGGLKTVNIRSLGTNHTGVFYNGIQLGNAQNGQIDLGRFSLDNIEAIQLYNGQKTTIHQSAKDYASASAIYMNTRRPRFCEGKKHNLNVAMKYGSFDTYNPSVLWEYKISEMVSAQVSAEYMSTSGKYRFSYAKKNGYDTTQVRHNGDVESIRVETSVFGHNDNGEWRAQVYFYDSERGYPGAAVREEPGKFKHQDRQWDTSVFAQASWKRDFSPRYSLLINAKVAYDYLHYLSDPNLDITTMYTDNEYKQTEAYLSASHLYKPVKWLSISLANDLQYNTLDANMVNFVYPTRWTLLTSLAANFKWKAFSAQTSLLHTFVNDDMRQPNSMAKDESQFTPSVALAYKFFNRENTNLSMHAFYKRIFRMPTFNDLYYTFIGNKALKPEFTTQYDVGVSYLRYWSKGIFNSIELNADVYYNEVEDKIVAMPASNQFRWTMMNFGLCHIVGAEASVRVNYAIANIGLSTGITYTFNRAMDHTDEHSEFYGGQLPYIPWHAVTALLSASYKGWDANYSFIYTGERYESSANIPENYSKPWYTSDISLSKSFNIKYATLRLTAEVCNIFNQQYEVVQCYPMPGTNFKLKLNINI